MDYDDLYIKKMRADMEYAILNGSGGDGSGTNIKNLLSPDKIECPVCKMVLTGTDYEVTTHIFNCENKKMAEEYSKQREANNIKQALLNDLRKLL